MMTRMGSLLTVAVVYVLLGPQLSPAVHGFLFTHIKKPGSLFDPSQHLWEDSNFTFPTENKALVILHNISEGKMQVLNWSKPLLHLPRGSAFSGFIYFRAQTPAQVDIQYFANGMQGGHFRPASPLDYCVAINTAENTIQQLPGFTSEHLQSDCVPCRSEDCPYVHLPCNCGWMRLTWPRANSNRKLPKIRFVGVMWWDPSDFEETPSSLGDGAADPW